MSKIYCWVEPAPNWGPTDLYVKAIAEDGDVLAGHLSSSISFAKLDIQHATKLKKYEEKYPNGYDLEWVDDIKMHEGIQKAFILNRHSWFKKLLSEGTPKEEALNTVWGWKHNAST
jgi:hypothetical protein